METRISTIREIRTRYTRTCTFRKSRTVQKIPTPVIGSKNERFLEAIKITQTQKIKIIFEFVFIFLQNECFCYAHQILSSDSFILTV